MSKPPIRTVRRRRAVPVLQGVGKFVRNQLFALMALGLELVFGKVDIVTDGEGIGVYPDGSSWPRRFPVWILTLLKSAPKRGSMKWRTLGGRGDPVPLLARTSGAAIGSTLRLIDNT